MPIYKFSDIVINSTAKKKPVDDDKKFYIGLEHLSPDTFLVEKYGSDTAPKGEKLLMKKGDVLFGKRRAYQKKVGIAPCDGIFSAHGMVLRPKEEVIDKNFFPFFIKSDYFLDKAIEISVGSLSPTINWGDLKELKFGIPSLNRQKELAELLWGLENLKISYKKLLLSSERYIRIALSQYSIIGTTKLEKIIKLMPKSKLKAGDAVPSGGYVFFTSSEQQQHIDKYIYDDELVILGTGGYSSINYFNGKFAVSTDNFSFKSIDDSICTKFIYYYLKSNRDIVDLGFKGSGMKHLSKEYLKDIDLKIISKSDQLKYLSLCERIEKSNENILVNVDRISTLQKQILAEAFKEGE